MSVYQAKKISILRLVALWLKVLAGFMQAWPLFLIAVYFLFPKDWMLRVHYDYELRGQQKVMIDCTYVSRTGFTNASRQGSCPLLINTDR